MQSPSKKHTNRKSINWLIYDISDNYLQKHTALYKGRLYDLGCGESPYKTFFTQYADSYTGVDWAECLHDTQADIVADLNTDLPIDSEVADTAVSLSVMEHLHSPQKFLNETGRILKPGGNILLQVPWQWRVHEAPHDYFRYTPYALKRMLEEAGFNNIQIEAQSGFFTSRALKFNYFSQRFTKGRKLKKRINALLLKPIWYWGQRLAPILDKKYDKDWTAETTGYFVTATKCSALNTLKKTDASNT